MKRIFFFLVAAALLASVAGATGGDPNIEGGGGGIGEGGVVGDSAWNPGDDGVRVSIMDGTTAVCTFDLSNSERTRTQISFVKKHKLKYKNEGGQLDVSSETYRSKVPPLSNPLPTIISSGGGSNIAAIRSYFTDEVVVRDIANKARMTYEELTSGAYKLLLEPMAYFKYNGVQYAMSATEAALFDIKVSGDLRYQMGRMTHQNLPFAMFLERADLTISPWTGPTTGRQSNIDILNQLGVGIVTFLPEVTIPDPPDAEYVYRADTNVITAALVPNHGGDLTPYVHSEAGGSEGYATFHINGTTYRKQMICPAGNSQLMWVEWHTPSTPCELIITVTPPNGGGDIEIPVRVELLAEKTPPDPGYDGPGQGPGITGTEYRPNFRPVQTPDWGGNTHTSWEQWVATLEREWVEDEEWEENWEWVDDGAGGGSWEDNGWWSDCSYWRYYWEWSLASYDAYLDVDFKLEPNSRVQTAELRGSTYTIKSGYGLDAECKTRAYGGGGTSDVTVAQNVLAVFPEFDYATYYRLLVPEPTYHSTFPRVTWGFRRNVYSYYSEPTHFTPLWYPDTDYTVAVAVFDAWTPGGMLYASAKDTVKIRGTMYDDWYIRVI